MYFENTILDANNNTTISHYFKMTVHKMQSCMVNYAVIYLGFRLLAAGQIYWNHHENIVTGKIHLCSLF